MKYLFISPISLAMFLVPRLAQSSEVEKIYFCTLDTEKKKTGKGMEEYPGWEKLELVTDWHQVVNENSPKELVVVIDDIGIGETGKFLRDHGYRVIGGSPFTDKIEDDRQFATDLMSRIMDIPESKSFDSWDAAIEYIKGFPKEEIFVFKPNDSEAPKEYTYLGKKGTEQLIEAMKSFRSVWQWKESFQIQKFVKGTEVDFSAYFNGKEYITNSLILYFENKPIMNDDVGPATGGSVAVEFSHESKGIFWDILEKFKPALKKANYVGQISINSIVSEENHKPHFLEFCGRFGYPSLPLDITLVEETGKSFHDLFMAMVNGTNPPGLFAKDKIAVTISCFVPPAPSEKNLEEIDGEPISWDKKWDKYFFPYYIKYDPKKKGMVLAGTSTWICQITCADSTLAGALSMLYDTYVPTLTLKDVEYRTDCGKSAKKRIKALKEMDVL